MGRKRSPENDWICQRCWCPCTADGARHVGGGQGMKACAKPQHVVLRSVLEAEMRTALAEHRDRMR